MFQSAAIDGGSKNNFCKTNTHIITRVVTKIYRFNSIVFGYFLLQSRDFFLYLGGISVNLVKVMKIVSQYPKIVCFVPFHMSLISVCAKQKIVCDFFSFLRLCTLFLSFSLKNVDFSIFFSAMFRKSHENLVQMSGSCDFGISKYVFTTREFKTKN